VIGSQTGFPGKQTEKEILGTMTYGRGEKKAESGDDSKISSGIALTGTGNRRGGKDLGWTIMTLF